MYIINIDREGSNFQGGKLLIRSNPWILGRKNLGYFLNFLNFEAEGTLIQRYTHILTHWALSFLLSAPRDFTSYVTCQNFILKIILSFLKFKENSFLILSISYNSTQFRKHMCYAKTGYYTVN